MSSLHSAHTASPSWNEWRWQLRNSIRDQSGLCATGINLPGIPFISQSNFRITPYYASLVDSRDSRDPVLLQTIPGSDESSYTTMSLDPLQESIHSPVNGLIQRFPDRALILLTSSCAVYCRFCTRKWFWQYAGSDHHAVPDMEAVCAYLRSKPRIRELIVSGGDPLVLPTETLCSALDKLRSVPHLKVLRLATRTPVVLPMRITDNLVMNLKKFRPLWVLTHFNHPVEITPESILACTRLVEAGIPVLNQSVLLKGVNDHPETLIKLFNGLTEMCVKPYYLFHCDPVEGNQRFRVTLEQGINIVATVGRSVSGIALPKYVLDFPGATGKVLLSRNAIGIMKPGVYQIKTPDGKTWLYNEHASGSPFQII